MLVEAEAQAVAQALALVVMEPLVVEMVNHL